MKRFNGHHFFQAVAVDIGKGDLTNSDPQESFQPAILRQDYPAASPAARLDRWKNNRRHILHKFPGSSHDCGNTRRPAGLTQHPGNNPDLKHRRRSAPVRSSLLYFVYFWQSSRRSDNQFHRHDIDQTDADKAVRRHPLSPSHFLFFGHEQFLPGLGSLSDRNSLTARNSPSLV